MALRRMNSLHKHNNPTGATMETQTTQRPQERFTMTEFRRVATSGEVNSYSALARSFGLDKATAQRTCKIHGITPSFQQVQQ